MDKKSYMYIFTRQDISPEQQLVQTAHVAYRAGQEFFNHSGYYNLEEKYKYHNKDHTFPIPNSHDTYFTCIGVRNEEALKGIIELCKLKSYQYVAFNEPDMDNQFTSVAIAPIDEDKRGILLAFNLLKF